MSRSPPRSRAWSTLSKRRSARSTSSSITRGSRAAQIEDIAEADWDDLLRVNLKSCFLVSQAILPGMRARRWGRIVNISSVAAQVGGVVGPHYAVSRRG